eukprot:1261907-Rhodomonas_salina.1
MGLSCAEMGHWGSGRVEAGMSYAAFQAMLEGGVQQVAYGPTRTRGTDVAYGPTRTRGTDVAYGPTCTRGTDVAYGPTRVLCRAR